MDHSSAAEQRATAVAKLKRAASLPRMQNGRRPPMHVEAVSEGERSQVEEREAGDGLSSVVRRVDCPPDDHVSVHAPELIHVALDDRREGTRHGQGRLTAPGLAGKHGLELLRDVLVVLLCDVVLALSAAQRPPYAYNEFVRARSGERLDSEEAADGNKVLYHQGKCQGRQRSRVMSRTMGDVMPGVADIPMTI